MLTIKRVFISTCLLLSLLLSSSLVSAETNDQDRKVMMKYRQLFMETKGKHAKAMNLLLKNKLSLNHIVLHAEALAAMAEGMLLIFPAGSTGGQSRAMDEIWDESGKLSLDFKNKASVMHGEALKIVEVAKQGNYKQIKKQMAVFANNGCRSCHSDYRGE